MRNPSVKTNLRVARMAAVLVAMPFAGAAISCTDLKESPTSTISPSNFYRTDAEIRGGLAGVYASLRDASTDNFWYLSQVSTDETVVPTRGQDWFDNGKWIDLHKQTWTPNSAITLDNVNGAWNQLFTGVSRANVLLAALKPESVQNGLAIQSEIRALRAFYYLELMDLFGNVPIVTDAEVKTRAQNTRPEVYKFVETELLAARPNLPAKYASSDYGRITQGAVDAMLASLYLNAEVWSGTVTAAGLQKGTQRWADVVTVTDRILNSGTYSLATPWQSNFVPTNENSPELIMVAKFAAVDGLGLTFINRAVHYNHYRSPGGWNGFSSLADTYNQFAANDQRRSIFLVGPQVSLEDGTPIKDRAGNPLVLTPLIADITQAKENEGVRVVKYTFDPNHFQQQMGNDYSVYRLGEIYLMKAEALNELGRTAEAVAAVNIVRARVFTPPQPLSAGSFNQASFRSQILKERLFELDNEGKRRQDMIRLGTFLAPFNEPASYAKGQTAPYKILFPIPQTQLQTNPLLVQNPGY